MSTPATPVPAARGLRRLERGTAEPEQIADFYARWLGWAVIAEPDGTFTGWVGDRLAARVRPGREGWQVVFTGSPARELRAGALVDTGRALHGPWAPPPRQGEPCWVELVDPADPDEYWTGELGWAARTPGEGFTLLDVAGGDAAGGPAEGGSRPVAGRLRGTGELPPGWLCYFAVPDLAGALTAAGRLGATVVAPARQVPTGLVAAVADPAGAVCALLQDPPAWGGALAGS
ncbi:VOC family protein [Saccharothrix coeruleofusca]|uniref:VOC family protein n=1 Tax=Saccharothrix coeruleofusca TaxID=33919 RepID=UPI0016701AEF|nr:VOC family protein [Saccharothrix coeruleofusca]